VHRAEVLLDPLGPHAELDDLLAPARRTLVGRVGAVSAIVADRLVLVLVIDERDGAARTGRDEPAPRTEEVRREPAAVEEEHDLLFARERLGDERLEAA